MDTLKKYGPIVAVVGVVGILGVVLFKKLGGAQAPAAVQYVQAPPATGSGSGGMSAGDIAAIVNASVNGLASLANTGASIASQFGA